MYSKHKEQEELRDQIASDLPVGTVVWVKRELVVSLEVFGVDWEERAAVSDCVLVCRRLPGECCAGDSADWRREINSHNLLHSHSLTLIGRDSLCKGLWLRSQCKLSNRATVPTQAPSTALQRQWLLLQTTNAALRVQFIPAHTRHRRQTGSTLD